MPSGGRWGTFTVRTFSEPAHSEGHVDFGSTGSETTSTFCENYLPFAVGAEASRSYFEYHFAREEPEGSR